MTNVQFDGQNIYSNYSNTADRRTFLVKLLMKWGWAKNQTQANYILIGIILLSITLSIVILFITFNNKVETPPEMAEYIEKMGRGNQIPR